MDPPDTEIGAKTILKEMRDTMEVETMADFTEEKTVIIKEEEVGPTDKMIEIQTEERKERSPETDNLEIEGLIVDTGEEVLQEDLQMR